ncbi:MAG: glycosyltransferase family 2 protein [Candidatus Nitronauta litoralis]|uniref:Glycosyltransferase family 2 protein n=1 Tax=Candidatus Nitronauta litoralis TaxID=2705533 RepID=A0A7T0BU05_9BACT|nr:MAG: glycosyltransferase family 2 protein [Candidatus Nitronauta litoralis]
MPGTCIVFCTAREAEVHRASSLAGNSEDNVRFFGPDSSPFNNAGKNNFIGWGEGPFTLTKALRHFFRLKSFAPSKVILPLNNESGAGYGLLRLFALGLSDQAIEIPPSGKEEKTSIGKILSQKEIIWHTGLIWFFDCIAPVLRLWLNTKAPPLTSNSRPPAQPETIQDFYNEEPPEASIIIRTFNEAQYLGQTLEAIGRQKGPTREIIVIDSGSTDNSVTIACSHSVRVYGISKESFHYSSALNLGARLARGKYLVNLSAHAVPQTDTWLAKLIEPMQTDENVAGVCGREVPIKDWASPFERKLLHDMFRLEKRVMTESFFFSNANAAMRRDLALEVPFDENIDWGEDQVWAHAVHQRGFKTVYTPEGPVAHSHNLSMVDCFVRTLKFQRTLFRRMHHDRADITNDEFHFHLPARALSFRRFISKNRLMPELKAWFAPSFCEYINFMGSDMAHREIMIARRRTSCSDKSYRPKKEAVLP